MNALRILWKPWTIGLIALAFAFLHTYDYTMNRKLSSTGDNYSYLALSDNMIAGNGYALSNSGEISPQNWFPPGYPAWLALWKRFGFQEIVFFKWLNGACALLAIAVWMLVGASWSPPRFAMVAWASAILVSLNASFLEYGQIIMSEMLYLLLMTLALWASGQIPNATKSRYTFLRNPWFYFALLLTSASYHVRGTGLALAAAIPVGWVIANRQSWPRSLAFLGGFALLLLPWSLRNRALGLKGRYLKNILSSNPWQPEEGSIESAGDFVDKLLTNINHAGLGGILKINFPWWNQPTDWTWTIAIGGGTAVGLVAWGIWNTNRHRAVMAAFLLFNFGIIWLWHGGNGARYLWPLLPFISYYLYCGVFDVAVRLGQILRQPIPHAAALAMLGIAYFFGVPVEKAHLNAAQPYPKGTQHYLDFADSVKVEMERNEKFKDRPARVICRKPIIFHHHSGAITQRYPFSKDSLELYRQIVEFDADYVVVESMGYSSSSLYLVPAVNAFKQCFTLVEERKEPPSYLLGVRREQVDEVLARAGLPAD